MRDSAALLHVDLSHCQDTLRLEVCFTLARPWTVLFGASGSGKTTILRAVHGFVRPHRGTIAIQGTAVLDTKRKLWVPPHRRPVRGAGQAARLFAGMTVRQNVLYGIEGIEGDSGALADEVLRLLRIDSLAAKRPHTLSGGEQQRVSVARAVAAAASSGSLLLLDEPFAGLGFALRDALAIELREWLVARRIPVLSVTHDVGEAFLLSAEVLRLENGRIAAQGPVTEVLAPERDRLLRQLHS